MSSNFKLSLFGKAYSGKKSIFKFLIRLNHKLSQKIAFDKKIAQNSINKEVVFTIDDYTAVNSFVPQSIDEEIIIENILQWIKKPNLMPDAIIYVVDLTDLRQNFLFLTQLTSFNIPIILLINISDIVESKSIDVKLFQKELGTYRVILFSVSKKIGLNNLKAAIINLSKLVNINHTNMVFSKEYSDMIKPLTKKLEKIYNTSGIIIEQIAFSLLCSRNLLKCLKLNQKDLYEVVSIKTSIIDSIDQNMRSYLQTLESDLRYGFIDDILLKSNFKSEQYVKSKSLFDRINTLIKK